MTLPSSGAISLNQMHVEAGGSSGAIASINDADIRGLISKNSGAQMSFNEWYGASAGTSVALTETGYNNETLSSNVTRSSYTRAYTVQNATVTSGKRHVIVAFTYRPLSLSGYTPGSWMTACTLSFDGTNMDHFCTAYSAFNATGIWSKTMDVGTGSKDLVLTFPVSTAGGNGSYSILILDDVNSWGSNFSTFYSTSSISSINPTDPGSSNFPNAYTHFLKLVTINTSNSSNNWVYTKGANEGNYTLMGAGDNGTNERNSSYYRFASGTMTYDISGTGSGNTASNGAGMILVTRGFK